MSANVDGAFAIHSSGIVAADAATWGGAASPAIRRPLQGVDVGLCVHAAVGEVEENLSGCVGGGEGECPTMASDSERSDGTTCT